MSEIDYQNLVVQLPVAILRWDIHGSVVFANDQANRLFGRNLIGHRVAEIVSSTSSYSADQISYDLQNSPHKRITNISIPFLLPKEKIREFSCTLSLDSDLQFIDCLIISGISELNRALVRVAESLTKSHKLEDILRVITRESLNLCNAQRAYIKLYDSEKNVLTFSALASVRSKEKLPEASSDIQRGMTGFAFRKQKPYRSGDVRKEPPGLYHSIFPDTISKVVVPLLFRRRQGAVSDCYGVISIDGASVNQFGPEVEETLQSLAKHAAIAIAQTKLVHEVQVSYEQLLSEVRYARDALGAGNYLHDGKNMLRDAIDEIEAIHRELSEVPLYKRKAKELLKRLDGLRDLRDLMRDVLDELRNPSKQKHISTKAKETNLRELVHRVINIVPIGVSPIEINLDPDEQSYFAFGEPTKILLVLYNLVTNAVTAINKTERPGTIDISVSNTPNNKLSRRIIVRDSGPGVSKPVLEFIRNRQQYSGFPGGSGLGLLTVRETINDLNGSIEVDSKFGKFTKFTIDLPGPKEEEEE